ncbi:hypothetical protein AB0D57_19635 [Streptomyces sp. NPDC048275]|uniref:hypothetical protein n=1 Tax=Streptomyces sp. NPDC048275 TaxID=3155629 RepID=UPI0033DACE82
MPDDLNEHVDSYFEERFGAALRDAGGAFEADRRVLVDAGEAHGRRLVVRRRRAAVAGGVAGVALVGLGGALLVPGGGGSERETGKRSVASGGSASASASATPTGPVSGPELVRTLEELLPQGTFSGAQSRGTDAKLGPLAYVVYDDGQGKAAISVSLSRIETGGLMAAQATQCPDKVLTPYDDCVTSTLPDGSVLRLFRGYEYPDRREDTKMWTADLVTPQGQHIGVSEWNAAAEKGAAISRDEPPLSTAQLKELVTAQAWRAVVDAIPEEPRQPDQETVPNTPPGISGKVIRSTLASLVPEGVQVVAQGGQETEYVYLVLDDGKGRSLLQINVQPDMSDVEHQLFGPDAETLPDGTKVTTHQAEQGGGVVMWTADTIRTDGRRVVVSALNTGGLEDPKTRATPALTMQQLKAIATSEKWLKLR